MFFIWIRNIKSIISKNICAQKNCFYVHIVNEGNILANIFKITGYVQLFPGSIFHFHVMCTEILAGSQVDITLALSCVRVRTEALDFATKKCSQNATGQLTAKTSGNLVCDLLTGLFGKGAKDCLKGISLALAGFGAR